LKTKVGLLQSTKTGQKIHQPSPGLKSTPNSRLSNMQPLRLRQLPITSEVVSRSHSKRPETRERLFRDFEGVVRPSRPSLHLTVPVNDLSISELHHEMLSGVSLSHPHFYGGPHLYTQTSNQPTDNDGSITGRTSKPNRPEKPAPVQAPSQHRLFHRQSGHKSSLGRRLSDFRG
jgi:hypothetical protein